MPSSRKTLWERIAQEGLSGGGDPATPDHAIVTSSALSGTPLLSYPHGGLPPVSTVSRQPKQSQDMETGLYQ